MADGGSLQERLATIRRAWVDALPQRLLVIQEGLEALLAGTWDAEQAHELHRLVHTLAGSGATFGLAEAGTAARELELVFQAVEAGGVPPTATQSAALRVRLGGLLAVPASLARAEAEPVEVADAPAPADAAPPMVWLVEQDAAGGARLAAQIEPFGFEVCLLKGATAARRQLATTVPDLVVLDVSLPEGPSAGLALIAEIHERCDAAGAPRTEAIVLTARTDLATRLAAVRAGVGAFLTRPATTSAVVDELERLSARQPREPYRLLIVEDDPAQAEHARSVLTEAGMDCRVVPGAEGIIEGLVEHRPELVLMDLWLEDCTGLELAALIRMQDAWVGIPIVFLSSERDPAEQIRAIQTGGDAFMTKPLKPTDLVACARAWLRRARALTARLHYDGLTGALNHAAFESRLDAEVARSDRTGRELSLAMIDLDHFKSVNDTWGHPTGDAALRMVSQLLRGRLRRTDVVARYGGEEFAVLLPDTSSAQAVEVIDGVRARLAELRLAVLGGVCSVTFSAGVASVAGAESARDLVAAADAALYEAKRQGRNQVRVAPGG